MITDTNTNTARDAKAEEAVQDLNRMKAELLSRFAEVVAKIREEETVEAGAEGQGNPVPLKLYTLKDVAGSLKVSYRTMLTYVKEGKLKAAKIGGRWNVTPENLQRFLNGD